jgi:hypothetical protein
MWDYARKLELLDEITSKSKLKENDAMEIAKLVKKELAKGYSKKAK